MEKLGERNSYMISHAFKSVGYNARDVISLICEDFKVNEADELIKFINWICDNGIPCTENTIEDRFLQYIFDNDNSSTTLRYRDDGGTEGG